TYVLKHKCDDLLSLARWLCVAPAQLLGLQSRKGKIAAGYDADLVVWNPETTWRVDGSQLFHRHKTTPYDGMSVQGRIQRTYLRGNLVFREGVHLGKPAGELLTRPHLKGSA